MIFVGLVCYTSLCILLAPWCSWIKERRIFRSYYVEFTFCWLIIFDWGYLWHGKLQPFVISESCKFFLLLFLNLCHIHALRCRIIQGFFGCFDNCHSWTHLYLKWWLPVSWSSSVLLGWFWTDIIFLFSYNLLSW